MRKTIGILAHVDAGKTTLSEQLLYLGGALRERGRVDHGDAFLDAEPIERERGITVFSGQADFRWGDSVYYLLDTPGHTDFSAEMERVLPALDFAVLVVSAAEGVQGHTETLWRLLGHYGIPAFLFLNKIDRPGADAGRTMEQLRRRCSPAAVLLDGFSGVPDESLAEELASLDDSLLERYLEGGLEPEDWVPAMRRLVRERQLFPCFSGSALKGEGVRELLDGLELLTETDWEAREDLPFGALAYQVRRGASRYVWLKLTAGRLRCRDEVLCRAADGTQTREKVTELLRCRGGRLTPLEEAKAGELCCVAGLSSVRAGDGVGEEEPSGPRELTPVLLSRAQWEEAYDLREVIAAFRTLEDEEPALSVEWNEPLSELRVHVMGEVQLEILRELMQTRFGFSVTFGDCEVLYRETIEDTVHACGHFEPLRHYAEVHFLLSPGERGSGITFESRCSTDVLEKSWQNLIRTHVFEKEHKGVLLGAPITDIRVTLLAGRAHLKHTEGGDFREAVYRAIRHGLMCAKSRVLEPWCAFSAAVPQEYAGRVMADVQRLCGTFGPPASEGETAVIEGRAPVATFLNYQRELTAFTRGRGSVSIRFDGYEPCHNEDEVVAARGYDPEADTENPAGSVFCSHGAGYYVPWREAGAKMHIQLGNDGRPKQEEAETHAAAPVSSESFESRAALDKELLAIFERTYGPVRSRVPQTAPRRIRAEKPWKGLRRKQPAGDDYLLVDGYNIVHAWKSLRELAAKSLDAAREQLIHRLANYQGWKKCRVIVVFDAYKVKGGVGSVEHKGDLWVVYTKEAETADMYIEKTTYELGRDHRVRVATSDGLEQLIILGRGAQRMPASELEYEVLRAEEEIRAVIARPAEGRPGKT